MTANSELFAGRLRPLVIASCVGFLGLAGLLLIVLPGSAFGRPALQSRVVRGDLILHLSGIPRGEHATITLTGPKQTPNGTPLRRELEPSAPRAKLKLAPGHYRLSIGKVSIRHGHGAIRRGAVASPLHRRLRTRVRAGRREQVNVRYGTILNPGVRDVSHAVTRILGTPSSPSAVVLSPGATVRRGQILSARPSSKLPRGLLARAISVHGGRREQVVLRAASIYAVAPNFSFDVPVSTTEGATASKFIKCGEGGVGAAPFVHLSDFHVSGGWTTTHLGPFDVKTGATAELHFRAAAGVKVNAAAGLSCELKLAAIGFQGMAGPIPVYGAVRPGATVDVGAAASMTAEGATTVTIGAKASGVPPSGKPIFGFSSPSFKIDSKIFAGVKAGISFGAEMGIGAIDAANLHVDLTNSLDFTAAPGECSWDLELGAFSATGEVGPLSISTPSTPALHKNLWRQACGPAPAPAPPAPPPPPTPVGPTLPLTRAVMSWDTDSDIDLYAWNEVGELLYFGDREGIPGAELVEDVIPFEGESSHAPEVFRETTNPDRRYTFGVCDFNRPGADVRLGVTDPDGTTRNFMATLYGEGEGIVLTTSPLGLGFVPEQGWCRSVLD
jgi:hypothetical protein